MLIQARRENLLLIIENWLNIFLNMLKKHLDELNFSNYSKNNVEMTR